jgi:hypothetical protein
MTLREYHDRSKHSLASVRAGAHALDWDNQPISFKIYPTVEPVELPTDLPGSRRFALDAIGGVPSGPPPPIDVGTLAHLLCFQRGRAAEADVPGRRDLLSGRRLHRRALSVDAYVVRRPRRRRRGRPSLRAARLRDAPPAPGDYRAHLATATADEPHVVAAPALLVLTSTFWRNAWKYRTRTYRHCWWDAARSSRTSSPRRAALDVPARRARPSSTPTSPPLSISIRRACVPLAVIALGTNAPRRRGAPRRAARSGDGPALPRIDYPPRRGHAAASRRSNRRRGARVARADRRDAGLTQASRRFR